MNSFSDNIRLCSLQDIASWQINAKNAPGIKVAMPALQRGYVWSAEQVEGLWDSLVRQLPIGSYLATRYSDTLVSNKATSEPRDEDTLLLLDGQQRATAIALAFCNPWGSNSPSYPMALWVDITPPESNYTDRAFMFRLLTHAHPWGYQRNSRDRLESQQRHKALEAFRTAIKAQKGITSKEQEKQSEYPGLSVAHTWPWDAVTPVPFALLCEAVAENNWETALLDRLNANPFWQPPMQTAKTDCWKKKITDILEKKEGEEYERLSILAKEIPSMLANTQIPVICIPQNDINAELWKLRQKTNSVQQESGEPITQTPPDAIESLFVRVNSAGTPLGGDELIYSTFKSIWPDSQLLVEKIGDNAFIRPANLVALCARLVISIEQDKAKELEENSKKGTNAETRDNMPPPLTVSRFRSLIHSPDKKYKTALQNFVKDEAEQLFSTAREFLAGTTSSGKPTLAGANDYCLGSILMENFARTAPDAYFFFLRWLYEAMNKPKGLPTPAMRKRIIGALTAIQFFSPNYKSFIRKLWPLRSIQWWHANHICANGIMQIEAEKLLMVPLPSPEVLKNALNKSLPNKNLDKDWTTWRWYTNFAGQYPKGCKRDYTFFCRDTLKNTENPNTLDSDTRYVDVAWSSFIERLWGERRLVLYAQRHWLDRFFPGYNPAAPDQLEDSDRPYDWDHIFPQSYIDRAQNLLKMWRDDWPYTIGNLRAWPMELNRSDGKTPPPAKLSNGNSPEILKEWAISDDNDLRNASFISTDWKYWEKCNNKNVRKQLTKYSDFGENLLRAITERLYLLYKHWYESLDVASTFGMKDAPAGKKQ